MSPSLAALLDVADRSTVLCAWSLSVASSEKKLNTGCEDPRTVTVLIPVDPDGGVSRLPSPLCAPLCFGMFCDPSLDLDAGVEL